MDADLRLLQGTWQAVRLETGTGRVPDEVVRQLRYVFAESRVTLWEKDRTTGTGLVTLHSATSPKAIDVAMTEGPGQGQVARGIYEVTGDHLVLCIGPERPSAFNATETVSLVELVRAQSAQGPTDGETPLDQPRG